MLKFVLKNVTVSWNRSLTLGTFIFLVSMLLILFNSFIGTVQGNINNALIHALTGEVQVRSAATEETDMFSTKGTWGDLHVLNATQRALVESSLKERSPDAELAARIRGSALFVSSDDKQPSMFIGFDPQAVSAYKKAFVLTEGRYLEKGRSEVLLTGAQAQTLKVKAGDSLEVLASANDGTPIQAKVTVAGIGDFEQLAAFSFSAIYTDLQTAQTLSGLKQGEYTDFVIYTGAPEQAVKLAADLSSTLRQREPSAGESFKVTTWKEMGGFLMGVIAIVRGELYGFLAVLMLIIGILIINLVFMMGMERRQDIGTLRSIGYSKGQVIQLFMSEVLLVAAVFCFSGVAVGTAIVTYFSRIPIKAGPPFKLAMGEAFYFMFDPTQILTVVGLIMVLTFVAALYPSVKVSSVKPVELLRAD